MEDFIIADAHFAGSDKPMFVDGHGEAHGETGVPGQMPREVGPMPQLDGMANAGFLHAVPGVRDISEGVGCAVYEEIFVKPLRTSCTEAYRAKRQVDARGQAVDSGTRTPSPGEWSQVFDLGPTSLICHVKGKELTIQVLHLTDQPLKQYLEEHSNPHCLSKRQLEEKAMQLFDEHQCVKLTLNGNVVPSLQLNLNIYDSSQSQFPLGINSKTRARLTQPYTLMAATTANCVYRIALSSYFLKKEDTASAGTIFVNEPEYIPVTADQGLSPSQYALKAFEVATDPDSGDDVYIYGLAVSPQIQSSVASDIGQTLVMHYAKDSNTFNLSGARRGLLPGGIGLVSKVAGKAGELTKGLAQGLSQNPIMSQIGTVIQNQIKQQLRMNGGADLDEDFDNLKQEKNLRSLSKPQFQGSNLDTAVAQAEVYRCLGDEEGVVAMLVLPQPRALCAVFSNGAFILRLISARESWSPPCHGEAAIVQENLLDWQPLPECFGATSKERRSDQVKVTDAKISSVSLVESSGRLIVGVAYKIQDLRNLRSTWRYDEFQLNIQGVQKVTSSGVIGKSYELMGEPFQMISSRELLQTQDGNSSVLHLLYLQNGLTSDEPNDSNNQEAEGSYQTIVYLWDELNSAGQFVALNSNLIIRDRQLQEGLDKILDQSGSLATHLASGPQSLAHDLDNITNMDEAVADHLRTRITKWGRYLPESIEEALSAAVHAWHGSASKSTRSQLQDVLQRLRLSQIQVLQDKIAQIDQRESKVLCLGSSPCRNLCSTQSIQNVARHPFRFLVRCLGISVLRQLSSRPQQGHHDGADTALSGNQNFESLANEIDYEMMRAHQMIMEYEAQAFKQRELVDLQREVLEGSADLSDRELFIRVASVLKLTINEQLCTLHKNITNDPGMVSQAIVAVLQSQFRYDSINQGLRQLIQANLARLQREITSMTKALLEYMCDFLPQRANTLHSNMLLVQEKRRQTQQRGSAMGSGFPQPCQMSGDLKTILEKSVLSNLESLSSLIIDIRLVQEYISFNQIGQQVENDWQMADGANEEEREASSNQLRGALWMRHQQLLAAKSVFSSRLNSPSRRSTGLPSLNRGSQETSILNALMGQDLNFYEQISSASAGGMFEDARDLFFSTYIWNDRFTFSPQNLSQRLLKFINQSNSGQDGVLVDSMSQYLKLMPDQSDLSAAIDEDDLDHVDLPRDQQFSAVSLLGPKPLHRQWMMLLEYYRAYTVAKLESLHRQSTRNGRPVAGVLATSQLLGGSLENGDLQSQYVYHMNNCLNYLLSDDLLVNGYQFGIEMFSVDGLDESKFGEFERVAQKNRAIQSILVMQDQFACFQNEAYRVYILQRAVEHVDDEIMDAEQRRRLKDVLHERIFCACKTDSEEGIVLMYKSCTEMSEGSHLRHKCVKMFFERLIRSRNVEPIKRLVFENDTDIKAVLQMTFGRIEMLFSQRASKKGSNPSERNLLGGQKRAHQLRERVEELTLPEGTATEILLQIAVLSAIANLYHWNDKVAGQLWAFQIQVGAFTRKDIHSVFDDFEEALENQEFGSRNDISQEALDKLESAIFALHRTYIELHQHVLTALYRNMSQLGADFFVIDDSETLKHNNDHEFGGVRGQGRARRSLQELQQSFLDHQMRVDERRDAATVFDFNNLEEGQGHREAESGSLKNITLEDVQTALLLNYGEAVLCDNDLRAQLAAGGDQGEYIDQVVEMLTELGHYDEAMEISLSSKRDSSAYCLSKMIQVSTRDHHQALDASQQNSWPVWNSQSKLERKPSHQLDEIVKPYLHRMAASGLTDLATYLRGAGAGLPPMLAEQLIERGLVTGVVQAYLSLGGDSRLQARDLLGFLCYYYRSADQGAVAGDNAVDKDKLRKCINMCAETDIHLVTTLVEAIRTQKADLRQNTDAARARYERLMSAQSQHQENTKLERQFLPNQGSAAGLSAASLLLPQGLLNLNADMMGGGEDLLQLVSDIEAEADNQFGIQPQPVLKEREEEYREARELSDTMDKLDKETKQILDGLYLSQRNNTNMYGQDQNKPQGGGGPRRQEAVFQFPGGRR